MPSNNFSNIFFFSSSALRSRFYIYFFCFSLRNFVSLLSSHCTHQFIYPGFFLSIEIFFFRRIPPVLYIDYVDIFFRSLAFSFDLYMKMRQSIAHAYTWKLEKKNSTKYSEWLSLDFDLMLRSGIIPLLFKSSYTFYLKSYVFRYSWFFNLFIFHCKIFDRQVMTTNILSRRCNFVSRESI